MSAAEPKDCLCPECKTSQMRPEDTSHPCSVCGRELQLHERYWLLSLLRSENGVAFTYLAWDDQLTTQVVIKSLQLVHMETWKTEELFAREANVLKALDHPQLPKFIEHFTEGFGKTERQYIVQSYLPGSDLEEERQHRRYTEKEVLHILDSALEALEYLHERHPPIIHRDLKPSNLLRLPDDTIAIVDFGIVRESQEPGRRDTTISGTLGYMAPEQFKGESCEQTDLYGLGAVALTLLSQKTPDALLNAYMQLDWQPHVEVSPATKALLSKLLAAHTTDRYPSATAARAAVQKALAPPKAPTHPPMKPILRPGALPTLKEVPPEGMGYMRTIIIFLAVVAGPPLLISVLALSCQGYAAYQTARKRLAVVEKRRRERAQMEQILAEEAKAKAERRRRIASLAAAKRRRLNAQASTPQQRQFLRSLRGKEWVGRIFGKTFALRLNGSHRRITFDLHELYSYRRCIFYKGSATIDGRRFVQKKAMRGKRGACDFPRDFPYYLTIKLNGTISTDQKLLEGTAERYERSKRHTASFQLHLETPSKSRLPKMPYKQIHRALISQRWTGHMRKAPATISFRALGPKMYRVHLALKDGRFKLSFKADLTTQAAIKAIKINENPRDKGPFGSTGSRTTRRLMLHVSKDIKRLTGYLQTTKKSGFFTRGSSSKLRFTRP